MRKGRVLGSCLGFAVSVAASACGSDASKPDAAPIVGVLELPIAHRNMGAEPAEAARVEVAPGEIRVDGQTALTLENGKVPAGEQSGSSLPKLKAKLAGKRSMALSVHAATPYATMARVVSTALEAGTKQVAFKVRKPGASTETGWLTIADQHFTSTSEDGKFAPEQLVPWDTFGKVWEDAIDACQTVDRGDCGYRPLAKAEGGKLDMMLRVRGAGLAIRMRQTGAPAPTTKAASETKPKVEMLEGIKAPPQAHEAPPEPSTEHVFTLRADHATQSPSPVSGIVKPVCSAQTCAVVVDAEGISMSGRVIALVGAAFPDGTPEPKIAWVLPPQ